MTQSVKIVTDSAADIPAELIDRWNIAVVPLTIRFDDQEFLDRVELSIDDFWAHTRQASVLPSTAAPSPGDFERSFRQAADERFESVICLTLSSKLSATYQAAVNAASAVAESIAVSVVDTESCTVSEGTQCLVAAEAAAAGKTVDEILAVTSDLRRRLHIVGALDDIEHLRKGGRIGAAGAFFATLLSVKPVITIEDGVVRPLARQRTRSRALAYLVEAVTSHGPVDHIAIAHSQANDVDEFAGRLEKVSGCDEMIVTDIGPTIGVHGGPNLIAVSFATET